MIDGSVVFPAAFYWETALAAAALQLPGSASVIEDSTLFEPLFLTAYYALFHRLIDDGVSRLVSGPTPPDAFGRAYGHADMKKVCQLVLKSPLLRNLSRSLAP